MSESKTESLGSKQLRHCAIESERRLAAAGYCQLEDRLNEQHVIFAKALNYQRGCAESKLSAVCQLHEIESPADRLRYREFRESVEWSFQGRDCDVTEMLERMWAASKALPVNWYLATWPSLFGSRVIGAFGLYSLNGAEGIEQSKDNLSCGWSFSRFLEVDIHPDFQRRGLGQTMMQTAFLRLQGQNARFAVLFADKESSAVNFYQSLGMTNCGVARPK